MQFTEALAHLDGGWNKELDDGTKLQMVITTVHLSKHNRPNTKGIVVTTPLGVVETLYAEGRAPEDYRRRFAEEQKAKMAKLREAAARKREYKAEQAEPFLTEVLALCEKAGIANPLKKWDVKPVCRSLGSNYGVPGTVRNVRVVQIGSTDVLMFDADRKQGYFSFGGGAMIKTSKPEGHEFMCLRKNTMVFTVSQKGCANFAWTAGGVRLRHPQRLDYWDNVRAVVWRTKRPPIRHGSVVQ